MTDTTTLAPTDAEILNQWDRVSSITFAGQRRLAFARAVLEKWGAPAPASGEPVMFAFKYADGTWHDASATEHSAGMQPLYEAAPPAQDVYKNSQSIDTSQKHVDSVDMSQEARVPLSDAEALAIVRSVPALLTAEDEWLWAIREVEKHHGIGITAAQKGTP